MTVVQIVTERKRPLVHFVEHITNTRIDAPSVREFILKVKVEGLSRDLPVDCRREVGSLSMQFKRYYRKIKGVEWYFSEKGKFQSVTCLVDAEDGCHCVTATAQDL